MSIQDNVALTQHSNDDTILRGSRAMAETLGLSRRAVDHLLQTRQLQSPRKLGGRWFVSRSKLLREIVGD
jgi:predicted DNA-binding transcriptional regulator AlpA